MIKYSVSFKDNQSSNFRNDEFSRTSTYSFILCRSRSNKLSDSQNSDCAETIFSHAFFSLFLGINCVIQLAKLNTSIVYKLHDQPSLICTGQVLPNKPRIFFSLPILTFVKNTPVENHSQKQSLSLITFLAAINLTVCFIGRMLHLYIHRQQDFPAFVVVLHSPAIPQQSDNKN